MSSTYGYEDLDESNATTSTSALIDDVIINILLNTTNSSSTETTLRNFDLELNSTSVLPTTSTANSTLYYSPKDVTTTSTRAPAPLPWRLTAVEARNFWAEDTRDRNDHSIDMDRVVWDRNGTMSQMTSANYASFVIIVVVISSIVALVVSHIIWEIKASRIARARQKILIKHFGPEMASDILGYQIEQDENGGPNKDDENDAESVAMCLIMQSGLASQIGTKGPGAELTQEEHRKLTRLNQAGDRYGQLAKGFHPLRYLNRMYL